MADEPKSDADCIQSAYEDAVQATFKSFISNIASQGDDKALSEFTSGLQLVRKAKTLALGIIQDPPEAEAAVAMVAPKRGRKR